MSQAVQETEFSLNGVMVVDKQTLAGKTQALELIIK